MHLNYTKLHIKSNYHSFLVQNTLPDCCQNGCLSGGTKAVENGQYAEFTFSEKIIIEMIFK